MKLLIISNMAHYTRGTAIVGWEPAVREIDELARDFSDVRHVGCLHAGDAPASMQPYAARNVTLVPLPPAGGATLRSKLDILRHTPLYVRTIVRELRRADVVHVRAPANIPLIALIILAGTQRPRARWVKYAGNWRPERGEPWSYRLQRWWLEQRLHRGLVTVNGEWPAQRHHVRSLVNPCLTEEDLAAASHAASDKELSRPARLLFVGSIERSKGCDRVVRMLAGLRDAGHAACLDVVGDGSERAAVQRLAIQLGVGDVVTFHGWLPRSALAPLYAEAHMNVLPSRTEGWPKVLSEGMAYGVVPIASGVGSITQYLEQFRTGRAITPSDDEAFREAVVWYLTHPTQWKAESRRAMEASELFTYRRYLAAVTRLLGVEPEAPSSRRSVAG